MSQTEKYLGGITGSGLDRHPPIGYGIHTTNKRIFGVRDWKGLSGSWKDVLTGKIGGSTHRISQSEQGESIIQDLQNKNDFVVEKEEISEIMIARPGILTNGYLLIKRNTGKPIKIRIHGQIPCVMVIELMNQFLPELVRVQ